MFLNWEGIKLPVHYGTCIVCASWTPFTITGNAQESSGCVAADIYLQ